MFCGFLGSPFVDFLPVLVDERVIAAMFRMAALGKQQVVEQRHALDMEGEPAGEPYCVPESGVRARRGGIVPKQPSDGASDPSRASQASSVPEQRSSSRP